MKKILSLFFAILLCVQILSANLTFAQDTQLPTEVETIKFDTEYWLEKGQIKWYRFEAPARQAYFTDLPLAPLTEDEEVQ